MSSSFETVSSIEDLFSTLSLSELQMNMATQPNLRERVHRFLRFRRDEAVQRFFTNVDGFWAMLTEVEGVISGSSALRFVLPRWTTGWNPKDLDIYIPCERKSPVVAFLTTQGYDIISASADSYGELEEQAISQIIHMRNVEKCIDIIESCSDSSIAPILRFHSTPVMNFFTADACFSAYPNLTTHYSAMINGGCLAGHRDRLVRCWKKYEERGYRYDDVSRRTVTQEWGLAVGVFGSALSGQRHFCREDFDCPHTIRATDDAGCLRVFFGEEVDENHRQHRSVLSDVLFWHLGGVPCGGGRYGTLRPFASVTNTSVS
ncbi:hypothetical protein BJ138DRAFT_1017720 [Hygrophoropsis aurantiaca]|uniref:Uncharacterized protein n=1 Tax=Hygrophoropsis aurantiaca TaxID=72124 RepID=A0ACB7ZWG4_9AGAM|nr:hypothetical protein BJ138DRAFT_1017720 [Hygrophoropsis aurantiaca]